MEAIETHSWTTEHGTAERTMTHDFGFGLQVVVDWKNMKLMQLKNGEVKSSSNFIDDHLSAKDYEIMLLKTEVEAQRLIKLTNSNDSN